MSVDKDKIPLEQITRQTLKQIGFTSDDHGIDCDKCSVVVAIEEQSPDIAQAVHVDKKDEELSAAKDTIAQQPATIVELKAQLNAR